MGSFLSLQDHFVLFQLLFQLFNKSCYHWLFVVLMVFNDGLLVHSGHFMKEIVLWIDVPNVSQTITRNSTMCLWRQEPFNSYILLIQDSFMNVPVNNITFNLIALTIRIGNSSYVVFFIRFMISFDLVHEIFLLKKLLIGLLLKF